jgi:hypothetical protein
MTGCAGLQRQRRRRCLYGRARCVCAGAAHPLRDPLPGGREPGPARGNTGVDAFPSRPRPRGSGPRRYLGHLPPRCEACHEGHRGTTFPARHKNKHRPVFMAASSTRLARHSSPPWGDPGGGSGFRQQQAGRGLRTAAGSEQGAIPDAQAWAGQRLGREAGYGRGTDHRGPSRPGLCDRRRRRGDRHFHRYPLRECLSNWQSAAARWWPTWTRSASPTPPGLPRWSVRPSAPPRTAPACTRSAPRPRTRQLFA